MAAQRMVWSFSSSRTVKVEQRPPSTASQHSTAGKEMFLPLKSVTRLAAAAAPAMQAPRQLPILLFDIMDTIVRDPFYHDVPAFFGVGLFSLIAMAYSALGCVIQNEVKLGIIHGKRMSMKELLENKHPTAWVEFEKGLIDEMELARTFFKDGRPIDLEGLKGCMRQGYSYIEGVEELLIDLKKNGYEMHASTNYPVWFEIIEEKLKLSTYLCWTFCSCIMGKRKPGPDFYTDISKRLRVEPACCIFIDDRKRNVEAALDAGFRGIQFKNVNSLRKDLSHLGLVI